MSVEVEGLKEAEQFLANIPAKMSKATNEESKTYAEKVISVMKTKLNTGTSLRSRSGKLASSFKYVQKPVSGMEGEGFLSIFSDSEYADIHENGGTIKAKNAFSRLKGGPFLAAPMPGVTMSVRQVFASKGFVMPFPHSPVARFGIMLNGKIMYSLIKQEKIKAQLGFDETVNKEAASLELSISEKNIE